jgi:hypothetical protein
MIISDYWANIESHPLDLPLRLLIYRLSPQGISWRMDERFYALVGSVQMNIMTIAHDLSFAGKSNTRPSTSFRPTGNLQRLKILVLGEGDIVAVTKRSSEPGVPWEGVLLDEERSVSGCLEDALFGEKQSGVMEGLFSGASVDVL